MEAAHLGSVESLKSLLKPEQQAEMSTVKGPFRTLFLIKRYTDREEEKEREGKRHGGCTTRFQTNIGNRHTAIQINQIYNICN